MNGRAMAIRWSILAALGCVLAATGSAHAATSCVNDDDCPNTACGGDVCDYSTGTPTCKAAGTQPKGQDGWCTVDSNCKCAALGATCSSNAVFCTFTKPSDAPSGGAGKGGTAGATGAAGSTAPGSGGTTGTGTGGASAAGHTGTDGGSSGGCSVAGSSAPATWLAFSVLGVVVAVRRRRRAR